MLSNTDCRQCQAYMPKPNITVANRKEKRFVKIQLTWQPPCTMYKYIYKTLIFSFDSNKIASVLNQHRKKLFWVITFSSILPHHSLSKLQLCILSPNLSENQVRISGDMKHKVNKLNIYIHS